MTMSRIKPGDDPDTVQGKLLAAVAIIEQRLEQGEHRFDRIEARGKEHADAMMRLDGRLTRMQTDQGRKHAELLGALEGIRRGRSPQRSRPELPEYSDADADAITDVTDPETLRARARIQRKEAQRWKKIAAAGPAIGAIVVAVWQALRAAGIIK